MCGCVNALSKRGNDDSSSSHVTFDLVQTGAACQRRLEARNVRVLLDKRSWLGQEFPAGEFACPKSTCRVSRGGEDDDAVPNTTTLLPPSVEVFVTAVPGGMGRPHSRPGQRTVALALESPVRYSFTTDQLWLRAQSVTDVVRPGIRNVRASPDSQDEVPTYRMTYSNADWEHYQRLPLPISSKIQGIASFITNCDERGAVRERGVSVRAGGAPTIRAIYFRFFNGRPEGGCACVGARKKASPPVVFLFVCLFFFLHQLSHRSPTSRPRRVAHFFFP